MARKRTHLFAIRSPKIKPFKRMHGWNRSSGKGGFANKSQFVRGKRKR